MESDGNPGNTVGGVITMLGEAYDFSADGASYKTRPVMQFKRTSGTAIFSSYLQFSTQAIGRIGGNQANPDAPLTVYYWSHDGTDHAGSYINCAEVTGITSALTWMHVVRVTSGSSDIYVGCMPSPGTTTTYPPVVGAPAGYGTGGEVDQLSGYVYVQSMFGSLDSQSRAATGLNASTQQFDYRTPMKFGGRVVRDVTLLDVTATVETRDGRLGIGHGSMTLGNIWAWPGGKTDPANALETMVRFGKKIAESANVSKDFGHPLELTFDFSIHYNRLAETVVDAGAEPMPKLAQLVAASPFEAAVFDAYGRALGKNSYNLLSEEFCNRDLSFYLGNDFRGEYLDQYTLRKPKDRMPLYHLVGALDPLTDGDVKEALNDDLPETFAQWIPYNGLTHIKIKLNGDDLDWDVDRVLAIDRVCEQEQTKRGCTSWFYSADFNERCENVEYVLEFLKKIEEKSPTTRHPTALHRLQYIEQPTRRDLRAHPENKMHRAAAVKPVVIDESLVDLQSLHDSREMGYSGVALKACKGQSEALLMGAAAQKYGMFLCVQDLTCVGASFLHSATLSARMPTVAAIEGNGRQYCPGANAGWDRKYPSMFEIKDGTLGTAVLDEPGLGFAK